MKERQAPALPHMRLSARPEATPGDSSGSHVRASLPLPRVLPLPHPTRWGPGSPTAPGPGRSPSSSALRDVGAWRGLRSRQRRYLFSAKPWGCHPAPLDLGSSHLWQESSSQRSGALGGGGWPPRPPLKFAIKPVEICTT